MGTWNTNSLYGNDTAADMRSEMRAVLSKMPLEGKIGGEKSVYMAKYLYDAYWMYEENSIIKTDFHYTNPIDFAAIKNEYLFSCFEDLNEINAITEIGEHSFVLSKEILTKYSTDYDMKLMGLL